MSEYYTKSDFVRIYLEIKLKPKNVYFGDMGTIRIRHRCLQWILLKHA